MAKTLYVTYDGLLDPLGQAQVVPLVKALSKLGHHMTVLSFEKDGKPGYAERREVLRQQLKSLGIEWKVFRYHKRLSVAATFFDMTRALWWLLRRGNQFDLVHLRSYPLGPPVLLLHRIHHIPFVFDMRGLWVQERIDGSLWRDGTMLVKVARFWERSLLKNSSAIVTLTQQSLTSDTLNDREIRDKTLVIPVVVDLNHFVRATKRQDVGGLHLIYHGSLGTWYDADALVRTAWVVASEGGTLTVLTNDADHPVTRELIAAGCAVNSCPHEDIPGALGQADAAIFFIKPLPSKVASSPTKLGEALACGLPVITGQGIGDVDSLLRDEHVGIVCDPANPDAIRRAIRDVADMLRDPAVPDKCREIANETFGLEKLSKRYDDLYAEVLQQETK